MAQRDDVAAVGFTVETTMRPAAIRAAGRRAAEAARDYLRTTITETLTGAADVRYVAHGPGGFVRQMALRVAWEETGAGRRRVRVTVGEHLVEQSRFLGVPVGRARVPALASARRFAAALRAELVRHGTAAPGTRPTRLPPPAPYRAGRAGSDTESDGRLALDGRVP